MARWRQITSGDITTVKKLTDHLLRSHFPDLKFENDFINAQGSKCYLMKYYLRTLEEHCLGRQSRTLTVSKRGGISPEHILPKAHPIILKHSRTAWETLFLNKKEDINPISKNLLLLKYLF